MAWERYLLASEFVCLENGPAPLVSRHLSDSQIAWTCIQVPLSDGRAFFVIATNGIPEDTLRAVLGNTGDIIARSYADLYSSDYPLKKEIFMLDGGRRDVSGAMRLVGLPVSAFVPGDDLQIRTVKPPVVFAGDEVDNFQLWDDSVAGLTISDGVVLEVAAEGQILFPCSGLGVINVPGGVLSVGDVSWRPAALYGPHHQVFRAWHAQNDVVPTFTGAFEFAVPIGLAQITGNTRLEFIRDSRAKLFRILTALSLLSQASPFAISEVSIEQASLGWGHIPSLGDIRWMGNALLHQPNVDASVAEVAIAIATGANTGRLSRGLRSALDALAHARFSWDRRIGYVLLWAAIEALATQDNREGLATNIALALLGARGPSPDAPDQLKALKSAYTTRSKLVHNFSAPADADLEGHGRLSFDYFKSLFAAAVDEVSAGRQDASNFSSALIARALARS